MRAPRARARDPWARCAHRCRAAPAARRGRARRGRPLVDESRIVRYGAAAALAIAVAFLVFLLFFSW